MIPDADGLRQLLLIGLESTQIIFDASFLRKGGAHLATKSAVAHVCVCEEIWHMVLSSFMPSNTIILRYFKGLDKMVCCGNIF